MEKYEKVIEGIHRIIGVRSNIYLIEGEDLILFDTGMPGDGAKVLEVLKELGYRNEDVKYILITHAHLDHVGSLAFLKESTGAKIVASVKEKDFIEGKKMLCSMKREGFGGKFFKIILFMLEKFAAKYEPAILDIPFDGNENKEIVKGIKIINTPGHSMGSLSYLCLAKDAVFTGDALTGVPVPGLPMRAGCSDHGQALVSVKYISELHFNTALFGHGIPVKDDAAAVVKSVSQKVS